MTKYHAYSIVEALRLEWASSEGRSPNCCFQRDRSPKRRKEAKMTTAIVGLGHMDHSSEVLRSRMKAIVLDAPGLPQELKICDGQFRI